MAAATFRPRRVEAMLVTGDSLGNNLPAEDSPCTGAIS